MTLTPDEQMHLAEAMLAADTVRFSPAQPVTYKSGLVSPVYVDFRRLSYWPEQWRVVMDAAVSVCAGLDFDVVAGVEAAGIPHSAVLGYRMGVPSVFVRKAAKAHGLRRFVEGGDVNDHRVLLVEDFVTTGRSSLHGVQVLRDAEAQVRDCLALAAHTFPETTAAFDAAGVRLHTLVPFAVLLEAAGRQGVLDTHALGVVRDWLQAPHGWAARHGFAS